jgi:YlmC/YmxH family sporulation protein
MAIKLTQLQCKEVICVGSGQRLGFIEDIQVELPEGKVVALTVPGPGNLLGLGGSRHDYCIPWHCIQKIGPDIVLVDINPEDCRVARPKQNFKL